MTSGYLGLILHSPKACYYIASKPMLGLTKAAALAGQGMLGYVGNTRSIVVTARPTPMEMDRAQAS